MSNIGTNLLKCVENTTIPVTLLPIAEAKDLQFLLNAIGYRLPEPFNGVVGDITIKAWGKFKTDNYLRDPLSVGKSSVIKLIKTYDKSSSKSTLSDLVLKVPFFPQTDNLVQPDRTCNTSSCAMVAKFLGAKISGDDEYWKVVNKYGDTTDHGAQTKALSEIGIKSSWHIDLDFADLDKSLKADLPIVIGILHRGDTNAPTGGHMIVVLGKAADGSYYICHDPYGNLLDEYTSSASNGEFVKYPTWQLMKRWTADGKNSGWGRLFER
jgi:hypothetical protein